MKWIKRIFRLRQPAVAAAPEPIQETAHIEPESDPVEHWSDRVKRLDASRAPKPANPVSMQPRAKMRRNNPVRRSKPTSNQIHAMRMARIDQDEIMAQRYGTRYKLMQLSALSPATRASHAARHGKLFTPAEVRAWYERDGNADDCKCSFVQVLLDERGRPFTPAIIERAEAGFAKIKARGEAAWTKQL